MALASVLLKSQCYYRYYSALQTSIYIPRRLMSLPRTQHGKPFIPAFSQPSDRQSYAFSVSHQYPFVGLVQFDTSTEPTASTRNDLKKIIDYPFLGLDIVVFEPLNERLYKTVEEFVDVFRDNFTPWEWDSLQHHESSMLLREFYLRWATKEAYTKALGVGLGFPFGSFQVELQFCDESLGTKLWPRVKEAVVGNNETLTIQGRVECINDEILGAVPANALGRFVFHFYPLSDPNEHADDEMQGCACVCEGPIIETVDEKSFGVQCEWTSMVELISWHTCRDET